MGDDKPKRWPICGETENREQHASWNESEVSPRHSYHILGEPLQVALPP